MFEGVFVSSSDERRQAMMRSIGAEASPWGDIFAIWNVDTPGQVCTLSVDTVIRRSPVRVLRISPSLGQQWHSSERLSVRLPPNPNLRSRSPRRTS